MLFPTYFHKEETYKEFYDCEQLLSYYATRELTAKWNNGSGVLLYIFNGTR